MKNTLIGLYVYALLIAVLLWIGIKCLFTWRNYRDAIIDFAFEVNK